MAGMRQDLAQHITEYQKCESNVVGERANGEVAAALRRVVRVLCLELSPGIRNVREGTHDVRASHSMRHNVAFLCAVQGSLLRRGSWLTH
jgi:hypothetical protein